MAYPSVCGEWVLYYGDATVRVGDLLELRGGAPRRLAPRVEGEWLDRFADKLVGRVRRVRHRLTGNVVETRLTMGSPLRSVDAPLSFMVREQAPAEALFEFRLDDTKVGLDMGFHLD